MYRVALFGILKENGEYHFYTNTADNKSDEKYLALNQHFVKWLTDWIIY